MAEPLTWIKLNRTILDWEWYTDPNTMRVFIHLLLKANVKRKVFRGATIHRGQVVASEQTVADELGLTRQKVRTAIDHLETTGEVSLIRKVGFSIITITNYDKFQDQEVKQKPKAAEKKPKRERKKPEASKPEPVAYQPKEWESYISQEYWGRFETEEEWKDFISRGDEEESVTT